MHGLYELGQARERRVRRQGGQRGEHGPADARHGLPGRVVAEHRRVPAGGAAQRRALHAPPRGEQHPQPRGGVLQPPGVEPLGRDQAARRLVPGEQPRHGADLQQQPGLLLGAAGLLDDPAHLADPDAATLEQGERDLVGVLQQGGRPVDGVRRGQAQRVVDGLGVGGHRAELGRLGGEGRVVVGAAQRERDLAGHLGDVPLGAVEQPAVRRPLLGGAGGDEAVAVDPAHRPVPRELVEQAHRAVGRACQHGGQPVGVAEHRRDAGHELAPAALGGQPEGAAHAAQALGVQGPGVEVGDEGVAEPARGGPPAGDGLGQVEAAVRPRPGEGVVEQAVQPGHDLGPGHPEEARELVTGGALADDQGRLEDLQRGQGQPAHDLHDGEVVAQAPCERVEAARPGCGDRVRAVGQDAGEPLFIKGRQPVEQVIIHHSLSKVSRESPRSHRNAEHPPGGIDVAE